MSVYSIEGTKKTPSIYLNIEEGRIEMKGRSLPENSEAFFLPFCNHFDDFLQNPADHIIVTFDLEYINTSTSKVLHDVMRQLAELGANQSVKVSWIYEEDDWEMRDAGGDFIALYGDLIKMIPKSIN
ncbi:DUF1987 domain-containing protein [Crocinitomix catalasitica]|nr:DUF1987 domain-containing protein [Crocinitomix catalasitica]